MQAGGVGLAVAKACGFGGYVAGGPLRVWKIFHTLFRVLVDANTLRQLTLQRLANLNPLADGAVGAQTRGGQTARPNRV